jgi:hypothetical protein
VDPAVGNKTKIATQQNAIPRVGHISGYFHAATKPGNPTDGPRKKLICWMIIACK